MSTNLTPGKQSSRKIKQKMHSRSSSNPDTWSCSTCRIPPRPLYCELMLVQTSVQSKKCCRRVHRTAAVVKLSDFNLCKTSKQLVELMYIQAHHIYICVCVPNIRFIWRPTLGSWGRRAGWLGWDPGCPGRLAQLRWLAVWSSAAPAARSVSAGPAVWPVWSQSGTYPAQSGVSGSAHLSDPARAPARRSARPSASAPRSSPARRTAGRAGFPCSPDALRSYSWPWLAQRKLSRCHKPTRTWALLRK